MNKKTIVITSGGTAEPIDSVRKITNMSTGKLGSIIAERLLNCYFRNSEIHVIYIHSKGSIIPVHNWSASKLTLIQANSASEAHTTLKNTLNEYNVDVVIHAMAVSDYTVDYVTTMERLASVGNDAFTPSFREHPENRKYFEDILNGKEEENGWTNYKIDNSSKISSDETDLFIKLKKTPKIIGEIKKWSPNVVLVGFKLLNNVSKEELIEVARNLLNKNNCDYVVANDLSQIREGQHKAYLISKETEIEEFNSKYEIASGLAKLIDEIE